MNNKIKILILFIYLCPLLTFAEYRVYQFYVRSKFSNLSKNQSYLVTTTLGPQSYVAYHGGSHSIEIELLRTWMCAGNTSGLQDYCKSPYEELLGLKK